MQKTTPASDKPEDGEDLVRQRKNGTKAALSDKEAPSDISAKEACISRKDTETASQSGKELHATETTTNHEEKCVNSPQHDLLLGETVKNIGWHREPSSWMQHQQSGRTSRAIHAYTTPRGSRK